MKKNTNLAIYVSSFDGYSDIWDNFFYRFHKFWSNCPYPVYLGCNRKEAAYPKVNVLHAKEYPDWSNRTLEHLEQIKEEYILLMLEDYYLNEPVNEILLDEMLSYVTQLDLVYLSLVAYPPADTALGGHPMIGLNSIGMQNRVNTQAAIWKKDALIELIKQDESLWEFELNASVRSNRFSGQVAGVWKTVLSYDMAVGGGKWFYDVYTKLSKEPGAVAIDTSIRKAESFSAMAKRKYSEKFCNAIRFIVPLRCRQKLKCFLSSNSYN